MSGCRGRMNGGLYIFYLENSLVIIFLNGEHIVVLLIAIL